MKKIPLRKCLATNKTYPKEELFRVVKLPSGEVVLDMTGKLNGRGAYIYKSKEAVDIAIKKKCLDRALEALVGPKVYEKMMFYLK